MNRRAFLIALGAAPWLVSAAYGAAQSKVPRIGFLGRMTPNSRQKEGFQQGLRELGYFEGKNILIEWRYTLGYEDELRRLAAQLVQMQPDMIVTFGTPAARAVLEATKTIPVVFASVGDPLATGLVANLARPEANGTGVSLLSSELEGAKISNAVRAARVPAVFPWPDYHEYRVLMYGPDLQNVARRGAYYVDKILKGAKPADLPVEQISQVELIIDLRVARELGINVPQEIMFRADRVIQ